LDHEVVRESVSRHFEWRAAKVTRIETPRALLDFRQTTHLDVVYLEGLAGDYYEEQPEEVARYRKEFERLGAKALDHRMTIKMIESLLDS
jgi:hypothetical protein